MSASSSHRTKHSSVHNLKAVCRDRAALFAPHVESFNFFIDHGIDLAVQALDPVYLAHPDGHTLKIWLESPEIGFPIKPDNYHCSEPKVFPADCREAGTSYTAPLHCTVCSQYDDFPPVRVPKTITQIPIMVKSKRCNTYGFAPAANAAAGEDRSEPGGYFIVHGLEKCIRMLVLNRGNYPMAIMRSSYRNRGALFTKFGITMRCVRPDLSSQTLTLHYLEDGSACVRISLKKQEYFIPVVMLLKAMTGASDREIYDAVVQGNYANTFVTDRIDSAIKAVAMHPFVTQQHFLSYLGSRFRTALNVPEHYSDEECGLFLLQQHMFIHLHSMSDKFNMLVYMMQKLYLFVAGDICGDNVDACSSFDVLLPGHMILKMLKEKLQEWLLNLFIQFRRDLRIDKARARLEEPSYLNNLIYKNNMDIGKKIESFLATGNLNSPSGLDLMQASGFTIIAERINYFRFLAHFRSIHRGAFFNEMKTTSVRKLLPESWGFLCPVHTPDGGPCGLLNHLASPCIVQTHHPSPESLLSISPLLASFGMLPVSRIPPPSNALPVILDGCIIGHVPSVLTQAVAQQLRLAKTLQNTLPHPVFDKLEIAVFSHSTAAGSPAPGIFLFSSAGRMQRPVMSVAAGRQEWIGPFEQISMGISVTPEAFDPQLHTHVEMCPTNMLSAIASFTPYSDMNQSPRNMYQCQQTKQSMGMPFHAFDRRTDNKVYHIITPQSPIITNENYEKFAINDYPNGFNAVVAVLSYTGYDMEDACIVNKASVERGFSHAMIYTSKIIDLDEERSTGGLTIFDNTGLVVPELDADGLPPPGTRLRKGMALYRTVDIVSGVARVAPFKYAEEATVIEVRILGVQASGDVHPKAGLRRVSIKLQFNRNPVIGDKFSSRHGQKGTVSILYPQDNMPFTAEGIVPDVIINPHAFPSRMTIGMLIESMSAKAGAHFGVRQDSTPFRFTEDTKATDYYGAQLAQAGYEYYGSETLYSGITGEPLTADIFIGVVYYQRLRQMVSDKYQVRSTGPINKLTKQPVKGRKVGGGIRVGEMERDALISHGAAFVVRDRLLACSDICSADLCSTCGSMLTSQRVAPSPTATTLQQRVTCRYCGTGAGVVSVTIPYVLRYLASELAAMNIKPVFKTSSSTL